MGAVAGQLRLRCHGLLGHAPPPQGGREAATLEGGRRGDAKASSTVGARSRRDTTSFTRRGPAAGVRTAKGTWTSSW